MNFSIKGLTIKKLTFEQKFVLVFIPFLNGIALSSTGFFKYSEFLASFFINPGEIRAIIILIFLVFFFMLRRVKHSITKLINVLSLFVLISCFWSPDFSYSFNIALKFFIWSSFFALGFYYINSTHKLIIYYKVFIISHLLIFVSFMVANIYNIGLGFYFTKVHAGAAGVSVALNLVHVIFFIPFFLKVNRSKLFKILGILLLILSVIYIIMSTKRGAIFGGIIGFSVYMFLSKRKKRIRKTILALLPIVLIIFFFMENFLLLIYEQRKDRFQLQYSQNLEEEARYQEIFFTLDYVTKGPVRFLFGYGFFSEGVYGSRYTGFYGRQHHIDYFILLFGLGIVGLSFFILIKIRIIKYFYHLKKINRSFLSNEFFVIVTSSIIYLFIAGLARTITEIDHRAFVFMFFGGMLRIMESEKKIRIANKINHK